MDDTSRFAFLRGLQRTGIVPGLERIRPLLARLGHPERRFASVLITGTNGKGSTAAFLEAILRARGYRTGLFTSPHLRNVRERVRISGRALAAERFEAYGLAVRAAMDPSEPATFFEALTAIGFLAFAREGVEVAVVEVGMGGRHDSTNVLDPVVSVLTNVSMDHQRFLGNTVEAIAAEKVDVARPGRVFVTGVSDALFDGVVGPSLRRIGAQAVRLHRDILVRRDDGRIDWRGRRLALDGARLSLQGTFQADNAALALAAAESLADTGFPVDGASMRTGLARTWWPGRFQRVASRPTVILDGAHNPGAAERLRETLQACPQARPLVLVHATRPDKDFRAFLAHLLPLCDHCVETTAPGLWDPEAVAGVAREVSACPVEVQPDLGRALALARRRAGEGGTVLVTGSLYLVGAVLGLHARNQR